MTGDIEQQVRKFVSDFWGVKLERLKPETRLEKDLGMTGLDGLDFLEKFSERFNIDMTECDPSKHFGPEGCNPLLLLLSLLYKPAWMENLDRYPVTIDHLVRVAETKWWFFPPCVR